MSRKGKSKHQLWHELCELISRNPDKVSSFTFVHYNYTFSVDHQFNSGANH